jgi:hypothetical protein
MSQHSHIPFCRAEFLQDVSIELGRRFARVHPFRSFDVNVDICEHEGERLERLSCWASTHNGTWANLTVWQNGVVWVCIGLSAAGNSAEYSLGFYPECQGFTSERFAEAFRDTVSVSTRLCYAESPLPILRKIWNHHAEVQTRGEL